MIEHLHVPLRSRRQQRALTVQKLNHVIPAFGLLSAGVQALRAGEQGFGRSLAMFEILVSAALIVTMARALREVTRAPGHAHHGVDWLDVIAAGVLAGEAAEQWHVRHHLARPIILTAVITLMLGLFHGRLLARASRRRGLRLDAHGIHIAGRPFRSFHALWTDVADVTIGEREAVVRTTSGRTRRLDFADLLNADEVRGALHTAREHAASVKTPTPAN